MDEIIAWAKCSTDNNILNVIASSHFHFIMRASTVVNWAEEPAWLMVGGEARLLGGLVGVAEPQQPQGPVLLLARENCLRINIILHSSLIQTKFIFPI